MFGEGFYMFYQKEVQTCREVEAMSKKILKLQVQGLEKKKEY